MQIILKQQSTFLKQAPIYVPPKKMLFKAPIGRLWKDFSAKKKKTQKTKITVRRQKDGCAPFVGVDFSCAGGRNCFVRSDIPLSDLCGVQYNMFYGLPPVSVCDVHLAVGGLDDRRVGKLALVTLKSEYRVPVGAVF